MNRHMPLKRVLAASAVLIAAAPAAAQDLDTAEAATEIATEDYLELVQEIVTDENWFEVERRAYKAQRDRVGFAVRSRRDLTVYEQRDLDRQGRVAQRARGARLPLQGEAPLSWREEAVRIATDENWSAIEARGVRAQRDRPGFSVRSLEDLTPQERFDLDRHGRIAQRARGARLPTGPVTEVGFAPASIRARVAAVAAPGAPRTVQAGRGAFLRDYQTAFDRASRVDFGAEAIGGRSLGLTEYAGDVTFGQVSNALYGGDPVLALARSTDRLGSNFTRGLAGIGQSLIDPRRIPGNTARAIKGTAAGMASTARTVAALPGKAVQTAVNVVTNPVREGRKAAKTGQNVARTICKGLAWIIPSNTNRKGC